MAGYSCLCGRNMFSLLFNAERKFLTLLFCPPFTASFVCILSFSLSLWPQSFYSSLVKTPEPYGVIFPHPAPLYHMQAFTQSHTHSNPTHTQLEPVDLSISKRTSSTSSSSSPPRSSASSPASSRSSPPSPYSFASRGSPRSSPSYPLPPPTTSIPYPTMVAPLISSGSGVIQGSGVMVSPVMVPLPVLYSSPLRLHQPIMVSPAVTSDDDHHRSREHKTGEISFIIQRSATSEYMKQTWNKL